MDLRGDHLRDAERLDDLRDRITIKTENTGTFELLGRRVTHVKGKITVDQFDYIKLIKPIYVPATRRKRPQAALTPQELTSFMSLTQQLAWPARSTVPTLAYDVSELQQKTSDAKVEDMIRANFVLREAVSHARAGDCLVFK